MKNLLYIGNKLSAKGKTVTTIASLSKLLILEGFTVKSVSSKSNKILRLLDMLLSIFNLRKKIDLVLIDTYSTKNFYYAYLCSKLCKILNLKYIPILHGGNLENRLINNKKISDKLFFNAYKIVSPSLFLKTIFEKYNYQNIQYVPNSIEIENYEFKQRKIDTIKLLWVRSFSKIYNPKLALEVLNMLIKEGVHVELCMVGPDSDGTLNEVKNYAKSLNLEILFTGKLTKDEWVLLSKNYNIFINTTNFDNMPVSVIEAMALGLPIVSTNVGGLPYLINNKEDGILVEKNNVHQMVEAIKELASNQKLANKLTRNARAKAEEFNWEKVKPLWKHILE